jgi:sugar phosphate isomerase/epimerase
VSLELGLFTDSVHELAYEDALDIAVAIGASCIEIAAGGMSHAPHLDRRLLLRDASARARWSTAQADRGLRLAALNCSAWLLHPTRGHESRGIVEEAMQLAGLLGVDKIVSMSGLPGDGPSATTYTWSWSTWPEDAVDLRERQWDHALELWRGLIERARTEGIRRIALELHPWQLVYNVPTLRRLRDAIGPEIGANVDPSHLFWQQMDAVRVIDELGEAVMHVHLKDTRLQPEQLALNGVLDHTANPRERAWTFTALGRGHGPDVWRSIFDALERVGYDDILSIENEDPELPSIEGVRSAAEFAIALLVEREPSGVA